MITVNKPMAERQTDATARFSGSTLPKSGVRPSRVLVIEDERDVSMSITKRLKHAGYEVFLAEDGAQATTSANRSHPDVVILDIGLPCGDGFTVAERLQENAATCMVPIIFLTARTSDADRSRAERLGAFAFLTKPFKSEDLLFAIERALRP